MGVHSDADAGSLAVLAPLIAATKRPSGQGSSAGHTVLTDGKIWCRASQLRSGPVSNLATTALSTNQSQSTLLATDANSEQDFTARQIWAARRRRMEVQNTQFGPEGPRPLWRNRVFSAGLAVFYAGTRLLRLDRAEGAMHSIFSSWLIRYRFQTFPGPSMVIVSSISAIRISIACRSSLQLPAGSSPGSRWIC